MFQEEGDGKDKQRLTHLRDGEQDDGVFHTERICIFRYGSKRTQEKVTIGVCYLKKKIAIFLRLNSTSASSPKAESIVFPSLRMGGQAGKVKA